VQAVGRHQVACLDPRGRHVARVAVETGDTLRDDGDSQCRGALGERGVQHGAADAEPVPVPEPRVGAVARVQVADSVQRVAVRDDPERRQPSHRGGQHALAARLVDRGRAGLGHRDRQAPLRAPDRRGEAHRAAADHENVDHDATGCKAVVARAFTSQRIRTVSSAALSTVNADAVIHADPVSGSANPSTITAT